jgi:putative aldouronate transport system permease protein
MVKAGRKMAETLVKHTRMRESAQDRVFIALNTAFLIIVGVVILYPLIYILSSSFSAAYAVVAGKVWLYPVDFSLKGYEAVFRNENIMIGYRNSFIYTFAGTIISVSLTIMAAYPLSRKDFFGRNVFMGLFAFTMLFSGGLIPFYLIVHDLKLTNTIWAMLLPNALAVWNVIIARTYFDTTIPKELLEASRIDGCNDFRFISSVVIPLSGPIIAVLCLFYAVGIWNSFFDALIFLKNAKMYPLQIMLRNILIANTVDANTMLDEKVLLRSQGLAELLRYSLIVVASVPVLAIYPFVQRFFVKGIMLGSVKG